MQVKPREYKGIRLSALDRKHFEQLRQIIGGSAALGSNALSVQPDRLRNDRI
jgi:hypothetical protein